MIPVYNSFEALYKANVTTNAPQLRGTPRPEDEQGAKAAVSSMKQAEQEQQNFSKATERIKQIPPGPGQTQQEVNEAWKKNTQQHYDTQKASYQAAKGQWQKSGQSTRASSDVTGFDDHEDDTKTYYEEDTKTL